MYMKVLSFYVYYSTLNEMCSINVHQGPQSQPAGYGGRWFTFYVDIGMIMNVVL